MVYVVDSQSRNKSFGGIINLCVAERVNLHSVTPYV